MPAHQAEASADTQSPAGPENAPPHEKYYYSEGGSVLTLHPTEEKDRKGNQSEEKSNQGPSSARSASFSQVASDDKEPDEDQPIESN